MSGLAAYVVACGSAAGLDRGRVASHAACRRCGGLSGGAGRESPNFSGMYDWSYFLLMLGLSAVASTALICWGYLH